jgi:DMSO/TMAO reductase YedYZ heme-binding membrane subunit
VATTRGRSPSRQNARSGPPGPAAEHRSKIMAVLVAGVIVIVLVLSMTPQGHVIDAATQHFMLFYAGVFALIGLTASVGVGLVATDRVVLTPGHRVMAQSVHRAVSFGALAFLIIHIVTEILAQRVHVIDAFVPFMSPFRTFYIGLGTISSDLILLLVVTSIIRKRFTANGKAWRWRAIHYTAYVSFVFGILHGLLGGRAAKPYVDWSYGFCIAFVALGLVVRVLAISLRPKENLSAPPASSRAGASTSPLRAAALSMTQAQLGGSIQMMPVGIGASAGAAATMGMPAIDMRAADPLDVTAQLPPGSGGFIPLGAPPYGDPGPAYPAAPQPAVASLPAPPGETRQPRYEPGYVGPPRYEGAPRGGTGPIPRLNTGPIPRAATGPLPKLGTGPMPRPDTGPMPPPRADTGPSPRPMLPRADTGPIPRADSSFAPRADTGSMPRIDTGPVPRADTGSMPRADGGPAPRGRTGPMPYAGTGPMPRGGTGPMPRAETGPIPRLDTGPIPRTGTGPIPRLDTGPIPRTDTGPIPRTDTGPKPRARTAPPPRSVAGPVPHPDTGPMPQVGTGPTPQVPHTGTGPMPRSRPAPASGRRTRRPDTGNARHRDSSQRGVDV